MRAPSFAGRASPCWHRRRRLLKPCTGMTLDGEDGYTYQLSLGEWTMEPPPAPTWRKFFIDQGIPHKTEKEIERICDEHWIGPEDFDKPVSERYWAGTLGVRGNPCAKAYLAARQDRSRARTWRPPAGRFWNFMKATTIPAATTVGSMQRTNSRCLCCRRG